jgi:lantibiotic modifying enzyme
MRAPGHTPSTRTGRPVEGRQAGGPDVARIGADSVFEYVQRTAEATPEGVRWETLDYQNRPHYGVSIFNGVAGIPLFLAEFGARDGSGAARDLALGGARWCAAQPGGGGGLCFGPNGVVLAWLELARTTGDGDFVGRATEAAVGLLRREPGPVTDFLGGAAGEVLLLLRLWGASGEGRHLDAARRRGVWLEETATRDEIGCHWPMRVDAPPGEPPARPYWGFAHGVAGIGHALLALYQATGEARFERLGREVAETLRRQAIPDRGGLNWPALLGATDLRRCQWCHGSPGVGLFFARAFEVLGDGACLGVAEAAGETTFAYGDVRGNPSQCHGLAGNAELFLELYRLTGASSWLERAGDFAGRALAYRIPAPGGETWQADDPGHSSPDYLCGAAGVGHFFLRLGAPQTVRMALQ